MPAVRSILVATDFSEEAERAVGRAGRIAQVLGCERGTLAHVQETVSLAAIRQFLAGPAADSETEAVRRGLQARLQASAETVARDHGCRLTPNLASGRPLVELARLAAEHDLVVLGARGSHKVRERLIGTLPQRLLGRTQQPLLVVRRPPDANYDAVVVGVDFSEDCARALQWAVAVAPEAPIHLVHVFRHSQELAMHYANVTPGLIAEYRQRARERSEAELVRFVGATGLSSDRVTSWVEEGDPASALCKRAADVGAGLIVVGKRGTSEVEDLLFGSVVQRLLAEADCDLLVTPHR